MASRSSRSVRLGFLAVFAVIAGLLAIPLTMSADAASTPGTVLLQGRMTDTDGRPVDLSNVTVEVKYYDASSGGNTLATETLSNQDVTAGIYNLALGSGSYSGTYGSLAAMVQAEAEVYFTVNVDSQGATDPRVHLLAVAYALNAEAVDGKEGSTLLDTSATTQTKSGGLILDFSVLAEQSSNPHTTTAGKGVLYLTDDSAQRLLFVDDADTTTVLAGPLAADLTLSSDAITLTSNLALYAEVTVNAESGTMDTISTISGGRTGQIIVVKIASGDEITFDDGGGNLQLATSGTITDDQDRYVLQYDGSNWIEISFSNN